MTHTDLRYDGVVLPDLSRAGWHGGEDEDPQVFACVRLLDVIARPHDTDAMFQPLAVPEHEGSIPRLTKDAAAVLAADGREPRLTWVFVDMDTPGHKPWANPEQAAAALHEAHANLGDLGGVPPYGYTTRAGLRLLWPLVNPVPVSEAQSYLRQFAAFIRPMLPASVELDPTCDQWHRVYRLPYVQRDGQRTAPTFVVGQPLSWSPEHLSSTPLVVRTGAHGDAGDEPEPRALTEEEWLHIPAVWRDRLRSGRPIFEAHGNPGHDVGVMCRLIPSLCSNMARVEVPSAEVIYQAVRDGVLAQTWPPLYRVWERINELLPGDIEQATSEREKYEALMAVAYRQGEAAADAQREAMVGTVNTREVRELADAMAAEDHPPLVYAGDSGHAYVWYPDERKYRLKSLGIIAPLLESLHGLSLRGKKGGFLQWASVFDIVGRDAHEVRMLYWQPGLEDRFDSERRILWLTTRAPDAAPEPRYHEGVAHWLSLLPSDPTMAPRLLDWLQAAVDPSKPIAALVMCGPKGTGKTLIGSGLGSGWGHTGDYNTTVGAPFNASLGLSPVLMADEGLRVEANHAEAFKSQITNRRQVFKMKNINDRYIEGCVRVVLGANSMDQIAISSDLGSESMAAIEERILFIQCSSKARDYLETIDEPTMNTWVTKPGGGPGAIFEHALWLAQNRALSKPPKRLVVYGEPDGPWRRNRLVTATGMDGAVLVALANWISTGKRVAGLGGHTSHPGLVLVNASSLHKQWVELTGDRNAPRLRQVADALATVAEWEKPKLLTIGNSRTTYHGVKASLVAEAAERCGIGDPDAVQAHLTALWMNKAPPTPTTSNKAQV